MRRVVKKYMVRIDCTPGDGTLPQQEYSWSTAKEALRFVNEYIRTEIPMGPGITIIGPDGNTMSHKQLYEAAKLEA